MNIEEKIIQLTKLKHFLQTDPSIPDISFKAYSKNNWFTPECVQQAIQSICQHYLCPTQLNNFATQYNLNQITTKPKNIGLVMAGNIPLVGFHDWLCCYLAGHTAHVKLSTDDEVLMPFIWEFFSTQFNQTLAHKAERLNNLDAYIATGSNNTSRYFEKYFGAYPHIIRKNRTSLAVLTGTETTEELSLLSDDVFTYFGLGCRNVSSVLVPQNYDFVPLLTAFKKYQSLELHHRFKNNYDYQLAIYMLNQVQYMSTQNVLMVPNSSVFSAVSVVHYQYYNTHADIQNILTTQAQNLQTIIGHNYMPFGSAQSPSLTNFADGVDTMEFLLALN